MTARRLPRLGRRPSYGDPLLRTAFAMKGYFWRFTDVADGRVVIALVVPRRGKLVWSG